MSTQSQHQPETSPFTTLPIGEMGARALEAVSAFAEANQRVLGQLIELSSTSAAERLRTVGELQSAAVEAARAALPTTTPREALNELREDPLAWYRKGLGAAVDGTQRLIKLFDTNAQIVSRSAQRFQSTAERSGKEIQDAVRTYTTRMREILETRGESRN
jgi:hypothetical protein